jgi:hypothetical protein
VKSAATETATEAGRATKRILWIAGSVLLGAAIVAPFLPLPFLRPTLEQALRTRLGRRVTIDEVSLSLLAGPGFALSGLTIHEDPRAGIEPFIYAPTADARIDLLGLIAGRRGFSSLRLANATLNLVKTDAGPWNFQYLLDRRLTDAPALHLRGTRVNLKVGQTKAFLYFDDADVDVSEGAQGALDVNFAGQPGRTDRAAQNLGRVFVRGSWVPTAAERPLNISVQLEPSAFDGIANLLGRTWFSLQGQVSLNAQLAGSPSRLTIAGEMQLDEGRRSDFLPNRDAVWKLPYRGTLDLAAGNLELENVPDPKGDDPVAAHLEAANVLTSPEWSASAELKEAALGPLVDAASQIGAPVPGQISAQGMLSGTVSYDNRAGLAADLEAGDAVVGFPNSPKMHATVPIRIAMQAITFGPTTLAVSETQSAQVEARYTFDGSSAADVRVATRGIDIGALRAFVSAPLLEPDGKPGEAPGAKAGDVPSGAGASGPAKSVWRGTIHYERANRDEMWTGDYTVENARLTLDGIAEPIHVQSASIHAAAGRWNVTKIRATAADIAFTGEYHFDPKAASVSANGSEDAKASRPQRFRLQMAEASAAEFARLLKPSLDRGTANASRARSAADWLKNMSSEGTLVIERLDVGDRRYAVDAARVVWDGPALQVSSIAIRPLNGAASDAAGSLAGKVLIDFSPPGGHVSLDLADQGKPIQYTGSVAGLTVPSEP